MKIRTLLTLLAAFVAVAAAASTHAEEGTPASPARQAKCRLVTGVIKTNFGTLDPVSVTSQAEAAAMDYSCADGARAGVGVRPLPVALYWTVGSSQDIPNGERTVATTLGTGGILGVAQLAQRGGSFVSVVVAP